MEPPPVRYVTTPGGYDIAYSVSGAGRPLVLFGPALGGMGHLWRFFPDWMTGLSARFQVVQHDLRGHGMSERGLPENLTLGEGENDLGAVLDRLQLDHFVLMGLHGVGHAAVRYAVAHPEQVEALILNGTTASPHMPSFYRDLSTENWQFFLRSMIPSSLEPEQSRAWFESLAQSTTYSDWQIRGRTSSESNIELILPLLRVPTLVLYARDNAMSTPEGARKLVALIPGARLVLIKGEHALGDAAEGIAAIEVFLAGMTAEDEALESGDTDPQVPLSAREREVLSLIARGLSNQLIADDLVISVRTVERHINHIYEKIGVHSKAQATAYALRQRL